MIVKLSLFVIALIVSAFFSSSETALTAINKLKLRNIIDKKEKGYKALAKILEKPNHLLTGILIGNNFANISATVIFTSIALDLVEHYHLPNTAYVMALITGGMTLIVLIVGEITPKTFALKHPETLALNYAKILLWTLKLCKPIIIFINAVSKIIQKGLNIESENLKAVITEDELKSIISIGEEEGILEKEETKMLHSIVDFSETIVREVMTPRTDVYFIDAKQSVREAIKLIIDKGHSRIPVFEEKLDNTVGIIYAKDLLKVPKEHEEETLYTYCRQAKYIPETTSIETVLHNMKKEKFHIAIVVDEHGGVSGIVTLEDILEEIVGEIQDEYDKDERPPITEVDSNHFIVDAKLNIQDLEDSLNIKFPNDEDYDTLGGFILSRIGRLPSKGERVHYKNWEFIVKEFSKRRIKTIEIIFKKPIGSEHTDDSDA